MEATATVVDASARILSFAGEFREAALQTQPDAAFAESLFREAALQNQADAAFAESIADTVVGAVTAPEPESAANAPN